MKLSKINYRSAIFFGIFSLVMYFVLGILQLIIVKSSPETSTLIGYVSPLYALVFTPLSGGVVVLLFFLLAIFIYNIIAKKFPIAWEVKK
ncbi:MAG: hypothetical protein WC548_02520 [Candidatus Pacearchaeota archaeon]